MQAVFSRLKITERVFSRSWWLVLGLSLLVVLPFQGRRPFLGRDEHRYPAIAWNMIKSGDYLFPKFKGHLHLAKPPFTYWALAASFRLFGFNPFGARFPNALALVFTTGFIFLMGRCLWDQETAWRAAFLYLGTLVPFIAANIVTTDTLLVLWETAALWAFLRGWREDSKWFLAMWAFWGLAFMTKGTAIFPVAAGTLCFWLTLSPRPRLLFPWGIMIFSLIALPWYLYVGFKVPGAFQTFWLEQVEGRLFSDVFHRNSAWYAPFYLYLPLITLGALPGFWFWLRNPGLWRKWRSYGLLDETGRFLCFQFLVPLLIFSLAKSRLPLYLLPLFVPFVLFTARWWRLESKYLFFWLGFLVILKGIFSYLLARGLLGFLD